MDDQGDHHCAVALRPPEIPKEPMEITTEEDRYAENEDLMSGNSFTLATSATSQLVLERIMSLSEVSPLA
ncbi:hypothetical protein J5N97_026183 [Dioscorea zingiberensis]|uniref:Uncharacterized protein n=1 Tax=Dioscorea zingiberensis TaxID=325984 RepID=A0A9D5C1Z1_9LILI|nr:hypothetical protein J5N97_026183 [Dioscorea zingiberensis]